MGGSDSPRPPIGTGGSGGGGGRRPPGDGDDQCACLAERVVLASPKPKVIASLKKNDLLKVELNEKDKPPVLAITKDDETAGAIIPSNLSTLVDCIKNGYTYKAKVIKIDGGSCTVDIQPQGKSC